jgi:hypothetical protein
LFSALAFKPTLCLPLGKTMRQYRICSGFGRPARAVTAAFAVVVVLAMGAFSVCPSLHQRVHRDSDHPDHFCVISAFAAGQLTWTKTVPAVAAVLVFLISGVLLGEIPLASHLDFYFCPNRAPPRL